MSGLNNSRRRSMVSVESQSLLGAVNRFVEAVDAMDDTVMIPCRLRDIHVDAVSSVRDVDTSMIPCLRHISVDPVSDMKELNTKAVVPSLHLSGDLHQFYLMLHAIRSEITGGSSLEEDLSEDLMNENDTARKTASSFRYHLRGLFGVLHQMTETAKMLSSRYEREVHSTQNGISSVSSFNM